MLKQLPKTTERVLSRTTTVSARGTFRKQRKRLATKLQNPRLLHIRFHTFRHWKATMEYHKTKDILQVKEMLGHKSIQSTLLYTQLIDFETDDDFHVRVAKNLEEDKGLIEAGFEYVTERDSIKIYRKRK